VASKPGGLNVRNSDDLENSSRIKSLCGADSDSRPTEPLGEGRRGRGSNRQTHPIIRWDHGSGILGKTGRGNVGKKQFPAGARSNLQRPLEISVETRSPGEGAGSAHELV
jgi:hypothetical protein